MAMRLYYPSYKVLADEMFEAYFDMGDRITQYVESFLLKPMNTTTIEIIKEYVLNEVKEFFTKFEINDNAFPPSDIFTVTFNYNERAIGVNFDEEKEKEIFLSVKRDMFSHDIKELNHHLDAVEETLEQHNGVFSEADTSQKIVEIYEAMGIVVDIFLCTDFRWKYAIKDWKEFRKSCNRELIQFHKSDAVSMTYYNLHTSRCQLDDVGTTTLPIDFASDGETSKYAFRCSGDDFMVYSKEDDMEAKSHYEQILELLPSLFDGGEEEHKLETLVDYLRRTLTFNEDLHCLGNETPIGTIHEMFRELDFKLDITGLNPVFDPEKFKIVLANA